MAVSEEKIVPGSDTVGKIAYSILFVVLLPALLILWALATADKVSLPVAGSPALGVVLSIMGFVLMVAGMSAIYVYGKGLPMNAYPPGRLVVESVYRYMPHPIYIGFSILCYGVAIYAQSPSGFWLVAPVAALGCVVLVEGYEKEATLEHFGGARLSPYLRLPAAEHRTPVLADRVSSIVYVLVPFLILSSLASRLAAGLEIEGHRTGDHMWPTLVFGAGIAMISAAPILARSTADLRRFVIAGSVSAVIAVLAFIAFHPQLATGSRLALTTSLLFVSTSTLRTWVPWALAYGLAIAVVVAGFITGAFELTGLMLGAAIFAIAVNTAPIWSAARRVTERIANSWREWRIGPVRIINHGFYAAGGAFASLSVIGVLVGPDHVPFVILITFLAITISALSAQWIEGSPKLLRPYGWYGGVAGAFFGALVSYLLGANTWLLIGAFCVGSPFVQAAGRLRCLVQGCCHGRAAAEGIGIRYWHSLSRVCRIAGLEGTPLHATQLYSITYNAIVAIVGLRLWFGGASLSLIVGVYYILTGMGRFVEESYRGEPQTPRFGGLRLYQIFAILSVIGGMAATMLPGSGNAVPPVFGWYAIVAAALFSVFVAFAFGVDFPNSDRRFSRLT